MDDWLPDAHPTAQTPKQDIVLCEVLAKTVLKFRGLTARTLVEELTTVPTVSAIAATAMHTLVKQISILRSPQGGWNKTSEPTPETLNPYLSDEVHEVLESLGQSTHLSPFLAPSSQPFLTLLESLISPLLWSVARNSYPIMQLIEGVRVCVGQPEQWVPGILRLAVILNITTPQVQCECDLVTLRTPSPRMDRTLQVQAELDDFLSVTSNADSSSGWIDHQLTAIADLLQTIPALKDLQQGLAADILLPGWDWQVGKIQLKLDFEFLPQSLQESGLNQREYLNLVEAELVEEIDSKTCVNHSDWAHPLTQISVTAIPDPSFIAAAIVRLATNHEDYAQFALQQAFTQPLHRIQHAEQISPEKRAIAVINEAYRLSNLTYSSVGNSFCLLQPELLMDELIPKLLWHITRSAYSTANWIGGLTYQLLQPKSDWVLGTLRLLAVLEVAAGDTPWFIDLGSGRFVTRDSWQPPLGAISKSSTQAPILLQTLADQLIQNLQSTAPEIGQMMDGMAVEWLTTEQDWQPGYLQLHLGLEFIPQSFYNQAS
ncbi:hypothetical protein JOY44_02720 [Phormidium sp. CLA17]|uniref:hypothetical protein n=1 Tax=Leptolyngbya sp. Cla-17 TaxID=2803751 RepID=UPI001490EED7|nr:hypothetical protein [Leptolyngbya sp. Cla-17]MBM0740539.1 hypothetical protein [Leptolyngbya sp. Cla-17]